ncbi:glycosyltransferase family 2 protein [Butyrivibrio sp. JL13D10]|uniref:glycosyltransferase family 2 protein n=1 Tax=Butyrivibrio sp. JL13D10 TaxID=3236815 RepID=UPI0038B50FA3
MSENLENIKKENLMLQDRITQLQAELDEMNHGCENIHEQHINQMNEIYNSLSWRLTAPIRSLASLFIKKQGDSISYYPVKDIKLLIKKHGTGSFPKNEERSRQLFESQKFENKPKFSILVPLYNTPKKYLRDMIESVLAQTYPYWELCLADASDEEHSYVERIVQRYLEKEATERIKYRKLKENKGISCNTNECVRMATGNYLCPFDHDDYLHPSVLYYYAFEINKSEADFLYCDEITFIGDHINNLLTLHCKPDFAPETLRSNNYICHLSAFKRTLISESDIYNPEYDGSQDYDLILRITENAKKIVHVPRVLYYWRSHAQSTAGNIGAKRYAVDAGKMAIDAAILRENAEKGKASSIYVRDTIYRIKYELAQPYSVKIILLRSSNENITTKEEIIKQNTAYNHFEIVSVLQDKIEEEICNTSSKSFIVLMEEDIIIKNKSWLLEYLMAAQRTEIGAVGGKLVTENEKIYSAGIALISNKEKPYIHLFANKEANAVGYMARLQYMQNVTGVSAKSMIVRADKLKQCQIDKCIKNLDVMGLDICLQLNALGYRNVFTPFAEMEVSSKNRDLPDNDIMNSFSIKWENKIKNGDSYLSGTLVDHDVFEVS